MVFSNWPKLNKVLEIHPDAMISGFNEQVYILFLTPSRFYRQVFSPFRLCFSI